MTYLHQAIIVQINFNVTQHACNIFILFQKLMYIIAQNVIYLII
jgi:hypothetical protein